MSHEVKISHKDGEGENKCKVIVPFRSKSDKWCGIKQSVWKLQWSNPSDIEAERHGEKESNVVTAKGRWVGNESNGTEMLCVCTWSQDHFHPLKRKKMVISTTKWNECYIKHDTWYSGLIQTHVCGLQMHCFPFSWHQWGIQVYTWVAVAEKDSCCAAVQVSNGYLCKKLFFFFFTSTQQNSLV